MLQDLYPKSGLPLRMGNSSRDAQPLQYQTYQASPVLNPVSTSPLTLNLFRVSSLASKVADF